MERALKSLSVKAAFVHVWLKAITLNPVDSGGSSCTESTVLSSNQKLGQRTTYAI